MATALPSLTCLYIGPNCRILAPSFLARQGIESCFTALRKLVLYGCSWSLAPGPRNLLHLLPSLQHLEHHDFHTAIDEELMEAWGHQLTFLHLRKWDNSLASCISRMPQLVSLAIVDEDEPLRLTMTPLIYSNLCSLNLPRLFVEVDDVLGLAVQQRLRHLTVQGFSHDACCSHLWTVHCWQKLCLHQDTLCVLHLGKLPISALTSPVHFCTSGNLEVRCC
jgi:hypothetical protein